MAEEDDGILFYPEGVGTLVQRIEEPTWGHPREVVQEALASALWRSVQRLPALRGQSGLVQLLKIVVTQEGRQTSVELRFLPREKCEGK